MESDDSVKVVDNKMFFFLNPANRRHFISQLVHIVAPIAKKFRTQKFIETVKSKNVFRHANISNTLFNQESPVHREVTFSLCHSHIHTHNWWTSQLETKLAQLADSLKILHAGHHSTCYGKKIGVSLPSNRRSHKTGQLSEKKKHWSQI